MSDSVKKEAMEALVNVIKVCAVVENPVKSLVVLMNGLQRIIKTLEDLSPAEARAVIADFKLNTGKGE